MDQKQNQDNFPYFKKLDVDLSEIKQLSTLKCRLNFSYNALNIYNIDDENQLKFIDDVVRSKLKFNIEPNCPSTKYPYFLGKQKPENLGPHVDVNDSTLVTINYYLKADGSTTSFWETRNENYPKSNIHTLKSFKNTDKFEGFENLIGQWYSDNSKLEFKAQFIANDNDVYLINPRKIHSVTLDRNNHSEMYRIWLRISWFNTNYSIEEIYNSIEIL